MAGPRAVACELVGDGRTDVRLCKLASAGHPNPQGAQQYALAVLAALDGELSGAGTRPQGADLVGPGTR